MKRFLLFLLLIPNLLFADQIKIPFSCWPIELKENFGKIGYKLDLSPNERTNDSWGYLFNEGSSYSIFTYHSATANELQTIQEVVFRIEEEKHRKEK